MHSNRLQKLNFFFNLFKLSYCYCVNVNVNVNVNVVNVSTQTQVQCLSKEYYYFTR